MSTLVGPQRRPAADRPFQFRPPRPAVPPDGSTLPRVVRRMLDGNSSEVLVEQKYDGWRVLVSVHADGGVTVRTKGGPLSGATTDRLGEALGEAGLPPGTFDCEAYVPGGASTDVPREWAAREGAIRLCAFDFVEDALTWGTAPHTRPTLWDRRRRLIELASRAFPAFMHVSPEVAVWRKWTTEDDMRRVARRMADEGWEGLVLKSLETEYPLNVLDPEQRCPSHYWVKVRPDCFGPVAFLRMVALCRDRYALGAVQGRGLAFAGKAQSWLEPQLGGAVPVGWSSAAPAHWRWLLIPRVVAVKCDYRYGVNLAGRPTLRFGRTVATGDLDLPPCDELEGLAGVMKERAVENMFRATTSRDV